MSSAAAARETAAGRIGRPMIIVSVVLHLLAFFFIVGVPRFLSSGPSGNKVYVVDLVTLPGGPAESAAAPAPAPAAATPAPEPPKPAPVKPPETKKAPEVKKVEPPKKPPKPIVLPDKDAAKKTAKTPPVKTPPPPKPSEPEKKDEPQEDTKEADASAAQEAAAEQAAAAATSPANPSTAPAKPGGAVAPGAAGAGGGGAGTGTGSGDEYDFYIALLKRRIEAAWKRPVSTARETRTAAVYFELSPTGRLLKLELRNPSGYVPFDRSIMQAVRDAEPFPAFPGSLKLDRLNPTLQFELEPLEGGGDSTP